MNIFEALDIEDNAEAQAEFLDLLEDVTLDYMGQQATSFLEDIVGVFVLHIPVEDRLEFIKKQEKGEIVNLYQYIGTKGPFTTLDPVFKKVIACMVEELVVGTDYIFREYSKKAMEEKLYEHLMTYYFDGMTDDTLEMLEEEIDNSNQVVNDDFKELVDYLYVCLYQFTPPYLYSCLQWGRKSNAYHLLKQNLINESRLPQTFESLVASIVKDFYNEMEGKTLDQLTSYIDSETDYYMGIYDDFSMKNKKEILTDVLDVFGLQPIFDEEIEDKDNEDEDDSAIPVLVA